MKFDRFNIRVYGIHIEKDRLLVTDEIRLHTPMTKLPGGGLEFGEGLGDCLKREWQEELQVDIEVGDIIYTNPFLQPSAFRKGDQIMALYFEVFPQGPLHGEFREERFDFKHNGKNDQQVFRWVPLKDLNPEVFTFPIDKAMVPRLIDFLQEKGRQIPIG